MDLNNKPIIILAATTTILLIPISFLYVLSRKEPKKLQNEEDPCGSKNNMKQFIANTMAWIAQRKEISKSSKSSKTLESWHKPENHPFFNESYYYNGCDILTRDRFITRISHRSNLGKRSYVFLLIDSKKHGILSLEEDIQAEDGPGHCAKGLGLIYTCEIPMKKWRIQYSGPMRKNCFHPKDIKGKEKAEIVQVELDFIYETDTSLFWYMRDDHPKCLANNLSQETWGMDFLRVCIKRTVDHGHYEDFGRVKGQFKVNNIPSVSTYDFGTFRDHSWDIRRWATMDRLCILLIALEKPLKLAGNDDEYWYLDVTLVDMPGNVGGVARYSTGYCLGKSNTNVPQLVMTSGTSILDCPYLPGKMNFVGVEREPTLTQQVIMRVNLHPRNKKNNNKDRLIKINMSGPIRRLQYWPDEGAFVVYEDYQDFLITDVETGQSSIGYGTRQTGYRVGEFDASLGGCG